MVGLFDTFRRHFVVLTKFYIKDMESRPYWSRGGVCRGAPGRAHRGGTDRARRVGAGVTVPRGRCSRYHPLQPLQAFRGPLRCICLRLAVVGPRCWTPVLPTRSTHPVYPPGTTHPARTTRARCTTCHQQCSAYSRFSTLVGEPRGLRTHPYSGPRTGYIQLLRYYCFTPDYDWFMTGS